MNEFLRNAVRTQRGLEDEFSSVGNLRGKNEMVTDCHLVPQYVYAESVHHVFCTNAGMKSFLDERGYKLEKLKDETLHSYDVRRLLDEDVIRLINEVYGKDFELCKEFVMI